MDNKNQIKIFKDQKIRSKWNNEEEEWYFSVIDVVGVLSQSKNPNSYWSTLKQRIKKEGNESVTNCDQLKMLASDGKYYKTDVANTEQIPTIINHILTGQI